MTDHSPESYRLLFAILSGGLFLVALVFIAVSTLIAPWWAVALLGAAWVVGAGVAVRFRDVGSWVPLLAATAVAVLWLAVITIGSTVLRWRP